MNNTDIIKGLYIHIPFCNNICKYCDFFKIVASEKFIFKYCDYLTKEIHLKKEYFKNIRTIYIGGGTPSTLSKENLIKIFNSLRKVIDFNNIIEFTIEANPLDITPTFLELIISNNVTRLSIGVQSFSNTKLEALGRKHNCNDLRNMFDILRKIPINVSCDLIFGLEKDTYKTFKKDIKLLLNYKVKHISLYALSLEEKTIFMKEFKSNNFKTLSGDESFKIFNKTCKFLKNKKYIHYEISNFAKKGYFSNHNLLYWNNDNYIGIGCSASSHLGKIRYTNPKKFKDYYEMLELNSKKYYEFEELDFTESMKEEVMLNLRKQSGIDTLNFFNKYHKNIFDVFPNLNSVISNKLLKYKDNHIFIPESKFYVSNYIINKII